MKKTFKKIVKRVSVAPPAPPDRETLNQADSLPALPSWDAPPPLPPRDPPSHRRHAPNHSVDSVRAFIRAFDGSPPETDSPEYGSPPSSPPRSPTQRPNTSAAHLLPPLDTRSRAPFGPVVGLPPSQPTRRSLSLWERRRQSAQSRQTSTSPPRVTAPPAYTDSDNLDDLPSAELRSIMESYIDWRGARRAAQATENAWRSPSTLANTSRASYSRQSTPDRRRRGSVGNQEDLRVAITTELTEAVTIRSLSPDPFAFRLPSSGPSSRRHSTGTIRASGSSETLPEQSYGQTEYEQAVIDEWRWGETPIGFEDAIQAFAEATGFDLDSGVEIAEQSATQPEIHERDHERDRDLAGRGLEEAAHAMSEVTPPQIPIPSPPSRQSSHSRSFLDFEETPSEIYEWAAKPLPDIPYQPLPSPTPSGPPQLPMLDIPTISLSEADFWNDLSFDSIGTSNLSTDSAPLTVDRPPAATEDKPEVRGLQRAVTLPPQRLKRVERVSSPPQALPEDDDKTPTAATSHIPPVQPTRTSPPVASPRIRPSMLRKISEPLLQRFGTRHRRKPFQSADLGRHSDGYLQLLDQVDQGASNPLRTPLEHLAPLVEHGVVTSTSNLNPPVTENLPSLAEASTEPLIAKGGAAIDESEGADVEPGSGGSVTGDQEADDELGSFGDLLAQFPLPPHHRPPIPHMTPSRGSEQATTTPPTAEKTTPQAQDIQTPPTQPLPMRSLRIEPLSFGEGAIQPLTTPPTPHTSAPESTSPILRSPLSDPSKGVKRLRRKRADSTASQSAELSIVDSTKDKGKAPEPRDPAPAGSSSQSVGPREDYDKTIRPSAAQMKKLKDFDSMLKTGETAQLSIRGKPSGKGDDVRRGGFV